MGNHGGLPWELIYGSSSDAAELKQLEGLIKYLSIKNFQNKMFVRFS